MNEDSGKAKEIIISEEGKIDGIPFLEWAKLNNYTGVLKYIVKSQRKHACYFIVDGLLHSDDGPAYIGSTGYKEYLLFGNSVTEEFHKHYQSKILAMQNNTPKKEETESKFIPQIKSDLRTAGIRVACRKSVSIVRTTLISLLTKGKSLKETKSISKGIELLFESEYGKGIIGYLMGQLLPLVKDKFPEKYQPIMDELSTEFRVEGLAVVGEEALTGLFSVITLAQSGLMDSMNDLLNEASSETEKVRILNEPSLNEEVAPKKEEQEFETVSITNKKEKGKKQNK